MDRPAIPSSGLKILYYADELRGRKCRDVVSGDMAYVENLVQHMIALTMAKDGVGLAAPQVGHFIRVAVVLPPKENRAHVLINPEITSFRGSDLVDQEGCLSIPPSGNTSRVTRSEAITVSCGSPQNPSHKVISYHDGLEARIIQHELDHLDGIFFIDRVSHLQRDLALKKYAKWRKKMGMSPETFHGNI